MSPEFCVDHHCLIAGGFHHPGGPPSPLALPAPGGPDAAAAPWACAFWAFPHSICLWAPSPLCGCTCRFLHGTALWFIFVNCLRVCNTQTECADPELTV